MAARGPDHGDDGRLRERKEASDQAAEDRLRALQEIADEAVETKDEPERLGLKEPGEYGLFTVLRAHSSVDDDAYMSQCAREMVRHLTSNKLLSIGWSNSKGGRMRVEQSLLAESWNPDYVRLGFDPNDPSPPFLEPAVEELAKSDQG